MTMKRKNKIISVVVVALMLTVMLAVPTLAAGDGVITIKAPTSGGWTLEDQMFDAYKIFDVTIVGGGEFAYVLDTHFTAFQTSFGKGDLATYISGLTANSDEMNELAAALWEYIDTTPVMPDGSEMGGTGATTVVIDNIPLGYYLVFGTGVHGDDEPLIVAACSLTTTEPTATVNLKLDAPTVTKTVWQHDKAGADDYEDPSDPGWDVWDDRSVGDTVYFKISFTVPTITGYDKYWIVVHDMLSYGFGLDEGDITVLQEGEPLTLDVDYIVNTTVEPQLTPYDESTLITITFDPYLFLDCAGDSVDIIYAVEFKDTAHFSEYGGIDPILAINNPNMAWLEYSSNPYVTGDGDLENPTDKGDLTETPPSEVNVYSFRFDIYKHTGDLAAHEDEPLPGAKFQLYAIKDDPTSALNFYIWGIGSMISTGYEVTESSRTGPQYTKTMTSPPNGGINILGIDAGIYWLYETEAPDGFNELDEPIKVEITHTNGAGQYTVKIDDVIVSDWTANIRNSAGQKFPSTGGTGRAIFIVIGTTLMAGSAAAFVARRKQDEVR